jgi:hypothetical protein
VNGVGAVRDGEVGCGDVEHPGMSAAIAARHEGKGSEKQKARKSKIPHLFIIRAGRKIRKLRSGELTKDDGETRGRWRRSG